MIEKKPTFVIMNNKVHKPIMKPRSRAFLDALPRNRNKVIPAAIEAGYSETYARSRGKTIMHTALKAQAQEALATLEGATLTGKEHKELMSDIIGIDRGTLMNTLRAIALQQRDLSSALKVLSPLAKEYGVVLDSEETRTIVPILNIGIRGQEPIGGQLEPNKPDVDNGVHNVDSPAIDEDTEENEVKS